MRALVNAVEDFKSALDSAVVMSVPALLGLLFVVLFARPTFLSVGGAFLRTSDLLEMDSLSFFVALLVVVLSLVLVSITYILVSLLVKERRLGVKITTRKAREAVVENLAPLTVVLFFLFMFNFVLQAFSLVAPVLGFLHIVSLVVYALLFFFPYALVIDNYGFWNSLHKSISLCIRAPLRFVAWLSVMFVVLVVFHALFTFSLPYQIAQYLSFFFSTLVALPFSIIFAAHLYMDRYPLS